MGTLAEGGYRAAALSVASGPMFVVRLYTRSNARERAEIFA